MFKFTMICLKTHWIDLRSDCQHALLCFAMDFVHLLFLFLTHPHVLQSAWKKKHIEKIHHLPRNCIEIGVQRLYCIQCICILDISMCVPFRFAATSRKYIKFINHIEYKIYSLRTQTHVFLCLKANADAVAVTVWQPNWSSNENYCNECAWFIFIIY